MADSSRGSSAAKLTHRRPSVLNAHNHAPRGNGSLVRAADVMPIAAPPPHGDVGCCIRNDGSNKAIFVFLRRAIWAAEDPGFSVVVRTYKEAPNPPTLGRQCASAALSPRQGPMSPHHPTKNSSAGAVSKP